MITIKDIKHLEDLSKLEFSDEEREKFLTEFEAIVGFASQITNAKTQEEGFVKTVDMNFLREDTPKPSLTQEEVVANAPVKKKGCFSVPRIME